ncbi:LysR family transcriptional regulator [Caulobacter sp. 73W]|uniref:LysR family transcriptional regulator n=1 Tax=Caulobacter sp. 73W TaxID=3161137 RepID=A0AB39KUJ4_9CAUL
MVLTRSAITHPIRNLQYHFGVRLFSREGRSVRLRRRGRPIWMR